MRIWKLDGEELERLRKALEDADTLRVTFDGRWFKYKVNQGMWTAGIEPEYDPTRGRG